MKTQHSTRGRSVTHLRGEREKEKETRQRVCGGTRLLPRRPYLQGECSSRLANEDEEKEIVRQSIARYQSTPPLPGTRPRTWTRSASP